MRLTQDFHKMYSVYMTYIIVGLGNPGEEYIETRHNAGRFVVSKIAKIFGTEIDITESGQTGSQKKGKKAIEEKGSVAGKKVLYVLPEIFMNKSGVAVLPHVKLSAPKKGSNIKTKTADNLIVVYDDFNLPLGTVRISYNRSSGGHNGLESIIKAIKTEAFVRVRIGIAPVTASGKTKIPHGESEVEKFILGNFKDVEMDIIKGLVKKIATGIELLVTEGREKAMSVTNQ